VYARTLVCLWREADFAFLPRPHIFPISTENIYDIPKGWQKIGKGRILKQWMNFPGRFIYDSLSLWLYPFLSGWSGKAPV